MSKEFIDHRFHITCKHFLGKLGLGLGSAPALVNPETFDGEEAGQSLDLFVPAFAGQTRYLFISEWGSSPVGEL